MSKLPLDKPRSAAVVFRRVIVVSTLAIPAASHPQTVSPTAAPLPSLLSHTHSIFIGNAGDQENADALRAYNGFYAGVNALHRFTLVTDPAHADMIVEMHYEIDLGGSKVSGGNSARQFRAVLFEAKTHTLVWSITERTNYATFQKNRDKNLDSAMEAIVSDFATLVSDQPTPPANNSRVNKQNPLQKILH